MTMPQKGTEENYAEPMEEFPYRDYEPIEPKGWDWRATLRKIWAPIAALIGLAIKFGAFAIKFFGIFISVGAYALIWGWKFAVGLVLLILVHEMGHFVEARRQGSAPSRAVSGRLTSPARPCR